MKTYSLTKRMIAIVVSSQVALTLSLIVVGVLFARAQLKKAFDATLEGYAVSTLALVRYTETSPPVLWFDAELLPPPSDPAHPDLFEIRAADGKVLARSKGWEGPPAEAARPADLFPEFNMGGTPYRAIVLRNVSVLDKEEDDPYEEPAKVTVFYATSLAGIRARLTRLAIYFGLTSFLLLLAANALAAWSVRRGLEPLHELAAQAEKISVHNWSFRSPSDATLASELAPLARAIETVLDRLKESFRQQQDFTSNAAHELKTSVAIVKSTLQSLLHRPRTQHEYRAGLEGLLKDCNRLEALLRSMLRLARIEQLAEAGMPAKLAATELTSTCEAAIARMRALAGERNISLAFGNTGPVTMLADPEDLELVWLNLLENAVLYSPSGSKVTMSVKRNGGATAEISVADFGPGIPPEELPHIFERFRRGDPSRARTTGGFGLGLAICKALVEAYGGTIEAVNLPGRGAEMRVVLPAEVE
jgi:signal transduction histidine kinase